MNLTASKVKHLKILMSAFTGRISTFSVLLFISLSAQLQPATPKVHAIQPVNSIGSAQPIQPQLFGQRNSILPHDPYTDQNLRAMQQGGMDIPGRPSNVRQQQLSELRRELREKEIDANRSKREGWSKNFQNNFQRYLELDPDSFSITKAVYLSESAYYDDQGGPSYEQFEAAIKQRADLVKQILKRENLKESNSTAVNYAIQKLYTQSNIYYDPKTKRNYFIGKIRYDFNDFMGDKDWKNMFVTKLLQTGSGQCHSLPLLFLCVAEQLKTKAYLSLSPNHSFIQYFDQQGKRYNFETTNGNLVSQAWLMQSTYVNATAFKNGTYLDTLSNRKLYTHCLSDMLLGYLVKIGYDNVSHQITEKILTIDSTNIAALMTKANLSTFIFYDLMQASGNPPQNEYAKYPRLNSAYKALQRNRQKVEQTGFQEMPIEAYKQWLRSLELEKQKEQNRLEEERLKSEIEKLKKIKVIFKNSPKR